MEPERPNIRQSNLSLPSISSHLVRFASLSLALSPPKNMSEEMDLALPNLFTASVLLLGPVEMGATGLLGLRGKV